PKLTMVSAPTGPGALGTRTFIPHRCHQAIGVLGAVSVATAARLPGSPAAQVAAHSGETGDTGEAGDTGAADTVLLEHPTGTFEAAVTISFDADGMPVAERSGIIRTARKLMDGMAYPRP
ncbi:MAG: PrpF domain-containing protein, partial [Acidimicrobiales bacterium]